MAKAEYHIHINGHEIKKDVEKLLLKVIQNSLEKEDLPKQAVYEDAFRGRGKYHAPKRHFTIKANKPLYPIYSDITQHLDVTEGFRGYVELEALAYENRMDFDEDKNGSKREWSLRDFKYGPLIEVPIGKHKSADIHIELEYGTELSEKIAKELEKRGFFTIEWPKINPTELVCTIQVEDIRDGKELFQGLRNISEDQRGIKRIDYEVTSALKRYPKDFPLWPYIPKRANNEK